MISMSTLLACIRPRSCTCVGLSMRMCTCGLFVSHRQFEIITQQSSNEHGLDKTPSITFLHRRENMASCQPSSHLSLIIFYIFLFSNIFTQEPSCSINLCHRQRIIRPSAPVMAVLLHTTGGQQSTFSNMTLIPACSCK